MQKKKQKGGVIYEKVSMDIYSTVLHVWFSDNIEETTRMVSKKFHIPDEDVPPFLAVTICGNEGQIGVVFEKENPDINSIAHECFHVASVTLRNRGCELGEDSEEAFAYLEGYLVEKIVKIINKHKLQLSV